MKRNNVIYFRVDDVIDKYKNSFWNRCDENYLLSNVLAVDYSDIATVLNKDYDDVIYKIIKTSCIKSISMIYSIKNIETMKVQAYCERNIN
jgi:homoserine acetyltransferase